MRRNLRLLVLVLLVALPAGVSPQQAAAPSAKVAEIRRLMTLTGAGNLAETMVGPTSGQMVPAIEGALGGGDQARQIALEFVKRFRQRFDSEAIMNEVVPVYDRHLTIEEIRGLIAFFESPIGKRLVELQPKILEESMKAGQALGERLGRDVMQSIANDHPEWKALIEKRP